MYIFFFFFNDTATTEIYTLSLHDALPISRCWTAKDGDGCWGRRTESGTGARTRGGCRRIRRGGDRKSTRLNSSHSQISYAVFCLKKKKNDCGHGCVRLNCGTDTIDLCAPC